MKDYCKWVYCPQNARRLFKSLAFQHRTMGTMDDYSQFVKHPRYGQQPRITGLSPETDYGGDVFLHWHSPKECRIPNTAIQANLPLQSPATVPVTHYFDVKRQCQDCGKPFIFFAKEQQYWYEELGFGLDSDCVRCVPCRKKQRGTAHLRYRYEELFHIPGKTVDQNLEMAECCMDLVEASIFNGKQTQHIRTLLNRASSELGQYTQKRYNELHERILAYEAKNHD